MLAPPPIAWTQPPSPPASAPQALGVERSLTGRNWILAPADDRLAMALAQRLNLPEIVARLKDRGFDIAKLNRTLQGNRKD